MDELERRLREADPLASGTERIPASARLDTITESVITREQTSPRATSRRRPAAIALLGTSVLVAVVLVANLTSAGPTLAFSPIPSPVSDASKAAAAKVCAKIFAGQPEAAGSTGASGGMQTGALPANRPAPTGPGVPWTPEQFPPLVALELHGTGGVALFENDTFFVACMLLANGDTFVGGSMVTWFGQGPASGLDGATFPQAEVKGEPVQLVTGTAPADAVRIDVIGTGIDGAYANVTNGVFALWVPASADVRTLVARDVSGAEIDRADIRLKFR